MNSYLNDNLSLSGGGNMPHTISMILIIVSFIGVLVSFIYYFIFAKPTTDAVTGKEVPASKLTLWIGIGFSVLLLIGIVMYVMTIKNKTADVSESY